MDLDIVLVSFNIIYGQVDVGKLVVEIAFFLGIDRGHQFTQHDSSNLEINPLFIFI